MALTATEMMKKDLLLVEPVHDNIEDKHFDIV